MAKSKSKYDGTEGEQEPGVDVAPTADPENPAEVERGVIPEPRSDDRTMSKRISKELPRHEAGVREAGLDVDDQHDTFEYQVVVTPKELGGEADPGPDSGAVTAAINAGYRPTGESALDGPEDHPDGLSKVFTWSVPVLKVKSPVQDDGKDNTKVSDRHDDAAKTQAENKADADAEARKTTTKASKSK
jgi:hypothetical protein